MTTLLAERAPGNLWAEQPGWGIVADLTPPELIETRRLAVLRRYLALALALVVLLCVGGYAWADQRSSAAADRLAAASLGTAPLLARNAGYADVVALQSQTQQVRRQIAALMSSDVDVAALVRKLHRAAPAATTLTTLNVSLTPPSTTSATVGGSVTDPVIGAVTMSGTSRRMVDVGAYVSALSQLRGVTAVVPTSNTAANHVAKAAWTITLQITDKLLSHTFAAPVPNSASGNAAGKNP